MLHTVNKHGYTVSINEDNVWRMWNREDQTTHTAVVSVTQEPSQACFARVTYTAVASRTRQPYNTMEERWVINLATGPKLHGTKVREAIMDVCKIAFREHDILENRIG